MLGEKLRELREAKRLVQRQVAAELEVDTAYISKMENNYNPLSKANLSKLAHLFSVEEQELQTLWLADQIYADVKDEKFANEAMQVADKKINFKKNKK